MVRMSAFLQRSLSVYCIVASSDKLNWIHDTTLVRCTKWQCTTKNKLRRVWYIVSMFTIHRASGS